MRQFYLTQANRPTKINFTKSAARSCGHGRATVRNVVAPGGAAGYLCRACYAWLRAVEVRTVEVDRARRELARLFRNSWPLGAILPRAALAFRSEVAR